MKILPSIIILLLVATLGASAFFYLTVYQPMASRLASLETGMPALQKANVELKTCRDRENRKTAWMKPVVVLLNAGLADEIKAGTAEVFTSGSRVIVNIAENALYQPGSHVYSRDGTTLRMKLISLLRTNELKGKEILVGNMAEDVPARGRGRRRVPAKNARALAAERSAALVKDLAKNEVDPDALIAAAYSSKGIAAGIKLNSRKTVIIIDNPPAVPATPGAEQQSAGTPLPRRIPIRPSQPTTTTR